MIIFKDINLSFPDKTIFQHLNLEINKGERVCLSGPSGRGKSTLLRMIQGYITPDKGEIFINDKRLDHYSVDDIRNSLTWIPQDINLPVTNGMELLQLMGYEDKLPQVSNLANKLLLDEHIIRKNFSMISGGQKQRVVIAICLSIDKPIILMDEPTAALDRESIDALLTTLSSMGERTIVSASHNEKWLQSSERVIQL